MIDKRLFNLVDSKSLIWLVIAKVMMLLLSIWLWLTLANEITFFIENQELKGSVYLISVAAIVIVCKFVLIKQIEKLTFKSSAELRLSFRDSVMKKAFRLGKDNNNQLPATKLSQLVVDGVEQLEIYYARFLPQFFYCGISAIIIFIVLARFSLLPAIALLICMPMIPLTIVFVMKIAKKILKEYWRDYTDLGVKFHENLSGLSTLKAFDRDTEKQTEVENDAEKFRKSTMALLSMQLNSITVMDIISYGGAGLSIGIALIKFSYGNLSVMGMLLFILLSAEFFIPMRQLGSLFHVAMNGISASDELFSYLELEEPVYGSQNDLSNAALNSITFTDVSASYQGNNHFSVEDVNLELTRGSFTAVIGKSGSGKSTLVKLLTGDFRDYEGTILWNNEDAKLFSRELIQKNLVLINNHSYIYNTSIKENFLLANKQATEEMMWEVLDKVNLLDFVKRQPNKLDSELDENGSNLSGGQRQRLILSRALLRESQLYVFDEITSGIDIESENNILNVIKELSLEKMVFFISHRLYNVLDADQIVVVDNSRILEKGSPKELLTSSDYFKTYFEKEEQEGILNERS